jgi:hypothetical protein
MTVQLHDCGQGQVSCVVLHVVQCHVPFHCHDSDGWLRPACIIMCWKDTHTHTHLTCKCICTHSCMMEVFRCKILLRTLHTCSLSRMAWFLEKIIQHETCLDGVFKFCLKHSCHILMKLEICRQIFEKYSNTKFHENLFSGSRDAACGRTDKQVEYRQTGKKKLMVTFRNYANAPKICYIN